MSHGNGNGAVVPGKEGLDEILRYSARLMAQRGYHGTSLRDIASETGRSLSGLYHYFQTKEDLVYWINVRGFSALTKSLEAILSHLSDPEDRLYALIFNHLDYFSHHRDEMKVLMLGTHNLTLERIAEIRRLKDGYTEQCRQVVSDFIAHRGGELPDAKGLTRATYLLFGMMNWIFGWYSPQKHGTGRDLTDDIFHTFVDGVCARRKIDDRRERVGKLVSGLRKEHHD
ncbi:MAG: TetR family transcriptional regulator [Myxococcaceae bacterium]|nr:TetR family transcriptional regulator [Myxococcaceae bacterium]